MGETGQHKVVKPELKLIWSPDLDDMEKQTPRDPTNFCILVQALVGTAGEEAADTFNFLVCTPSRLAQRIPPGGALSGWTYVVVERYDYGVIKKALEEFCDQAAAQDWSRAASILGRYGRWEYEQ